MVVIALVILETNSTHAWVHPRNLCKPRGKSWELTGLGGQNFNGTGNLFDPWVHHRTLFKPSENSWELTGHGWHSLGDIGN